MTAVRIRPADLGRVGDRAARAARRATPAPGARRGGSSATASARCRGCTSARRGGPRTASRARIDSTQRPTPAGGIGTLVRSGGPGGDELAPGAHAVARVGVLGGDRLLGAVDRHREAVGRRVFGHPAQRRHGDRGRQAVGQAGLDEALVGGPRRVVVVDVAEEPVLAGVPRVAELPVVAARVVPAPAAGGRAEAPLVRVRGVVHGQDPDAVDEGADRVGRRAAADRERHGLRAPCSPPRRGSAERRTASGPRDGPPRGRSWGRFSRRMWPWCSGPG